jgi:hypothetical protein
MEIKNNHLIQHHECDFDLDKLRAEIEDISVFKNFYVPHSNMLIEGWFYHKATKEYSVGIAHYLADITNTDIQEVSSRFYIQEKGYAIPFHRDVGTMCSLNILLSEANDPIYFYQKGEKTHHSYKSALINVSEQHSVPAPIDEPRLLFKVSFFSKSFKDIASVLPTQLSYR